MTQVSSGSQMNAAQISSTNPISSGISVFTGKKSDALSERVDALESQLAAARGQDTNNIISNMTKPTDSAGASGADTASVTPPANTDTSSKEAAVKAELDAVKSEYDQAKKDEEAEADAAKADAAKADVARATEPARQPQTQTSPTS